MSFARWLNRQLVTEDRQGHLAPPGAGAAQVWRQSDGSEVALIARGDALDIYIGRERVVNLTLEPRTAVAMALWLLRWWRRTMWFGLKLRLWRWSQGKLLEQQAHGKEP